MEDCSCQGLHKGAKEISKKDLMVRHTTIENRNKQ